MTTVAAQPRTQTPPVAAKPKGPSWREASAAYLYLLPATVILVGFHFLPVFYAFYISLFQWRIVQGPFVGLENYLYIFTSFDFWQSIVVTVYYALGTIPVTLVLSFFIAYLLFQKVAGKGLYRLVYFMPYVTSTVAAALVFRWIFHSQYGILNFIITKIGIGAQTWLLQPKGIFRLLFSALGIALPPWAAGPSLALVSIMLFTIWQSMGFSVVILLAGLSNIPNELYDAARIDGAGEWRIMRYITLPLLTPTLFFLLIVSVIHAFQTFSGIYVMSDPQHGGPLGTTTNATMYIFLNFFEYARLSRASAAAFVLLFIVLALTLIQMRVIAPRVHY